MPRPALLRRTVRRILSPPGRGCRPMPRCHAPDLGGRRTGPPAPLRLGSAHHRARACGHPARRRRRRPRRPRPAPARLRGGDRPARPARRRRRRRGLLRPSSSPVSTPTPVTDGPRRRPPHRGRRSGGVLDDWRLYILSDSAAARGQHSGGPGRSGDAARRLSPLGAAPRALTKAAPSPGSATTAGRPRAGRRRPPPREVSGAAAAQLERLAWQIGAKLPGDAGGARGRRPPAAHRGAGRRPRASSRRHLPPAERRLCRTGPLLTAGSSQRGRASSSLSSCSRAARSRPSTPSPPPSARSRLGRAARRRPSPAEHQGMAALAALADAGPPRLPRGGEVEWERRSGRRATRHRLPRAHEAPRGRRGNLRFRASLPAAPPPRRADRRPTAACAPRRCGASTPKFGRRPLRRSHRRAAAAAPTSTRRTQPARATCGTSAGSSTPPATTPARWATGRSCPPLPRGQQRPARPLLDGRGPSRRWEQRSRAQQIYREIAAVGHNDFYRKNALDRLGGEAGRGAGRRARQRRALARGPRPRRARLLTDLGLEDLAVSELEPTRAKPSRARYGRPRSADPRPPRRPPKEHRRRSATPSPLSAPPIQAACRTMRCGSTTRSTIRSRSASGPSERACPSHLVFGIIRQESAFDTRAQSWAGARGLMQLMPATAQELAGQLGALLHSTKSSPTRSSTSAWGPPTSARCSTCSTATSTSRSPATTAAPTASSACGARRRRPRAGPLPRGAHPRGVEDLRQADPPALGQLPAALPRRPQGRRRHALDRGYWFSSTGDRRRRGLPRPRAGRARWCGALRLVYCLLALTARRGALRSRSRNLRVHSSAVRASGS